MDEDALEGQKDVYGDLLEEAHKALASNQGRHFQASGMVKQGVRSGSGTIIQGTDWPRVFRTACTSIWIFRWRRCGRQQRRWRFKLGLIFKS